MEEMNKEICQEALENEVVEAPSEAEEKQNIEELLENGDSTDTDEPLDKNVRLMSPTRMVVRRFFRSKLSIVGLIMVVGLFIFCFLGPVIYNQWGETEYDATVVVQPDTTTLKVVINGQEFEIKETVEAEIKYTSYAPISKDHLLGTDQTGYDIFSRLMYGGRISLIVSFLSVFVITILGVIAGGIAGYFGGKVDNVIMRICDILMCLPGVPILLIIGLILDNMTGVPVLGDPSARIYLLMLFLTFISWPGTARLVRGQILSLREQEYMVAAEAMGYSAKRKIFKHLVPNVMPQLIVQMSLSLGSMILYEASLSFLGLGVRAPQAAWGTMINILTLDPNVITLHPLVWLPAGICIVIAVLGFNFVGDGLRDALDPKARR